MKNQPRGLRIEDASEETTGIYFYEWIGENRGGITAKDFVTNLNSIKTPKIDIYVTCPGGDVADAVTIYNAIKNHPAEVSTWGDSVVASAGTYPLLAGDRVYMSEFGSLMIHNPMMEAYGNIDEFKKCVEILGHVAETIRNIYVKKTGQTNDQITQWLNEETWFNPTEALAAGFIDEIYETRRPVNCFDLTMYQNTPENLINPEQITLINTIRDFEVKLRDELGFSNRQAKKIAAGGWPALVRDEQNQGIDGGVLNKHIEELTQQLKGLFL